jgi:hypothetical protein
VRVFISHSAKDQHANEVLERLSAELRQYFDVRVDREDLRLGVNWRAEINTWLGYCEAAIVLLSEDAVESPYVAYEVSILGHRKAIQFQFPLIPVFLGAVDYARVEQSRLSPSRIQDVQAVVRLSSVEAIVANVISRLRQGQAEMTPVDKQVDVLAELLDDLSARQVQKAVSMLTVDLGSWSNKSDERRNLAVKMLSAGIQEARKVLREIRVAWDNKPQRLTAALDLVACSWVDLPTAKRIHSIAQNRAIRRIALQTREQPIAGMYVMRAGAGSAGRSPIDPWPVAEVQGVLSESATDDLRRMVRVHLMNATNATEDELDQALQTYEEDAWPVFVLLNSEIVKLVTYETLTALHDAFPTVTFVLPTGAFETLPAYIQTANIEVLKSKVPGDNESKYCHDYKWCRGRLRDDYGGMERTAR